MSSRSTFCNHYFRLSEVATLVGACLPTLQECIVQKLREQRHVHVPHTQSPLIESLEPTRGKASERGVDARKSLQNIRNRSTKIGVSLVLFCYRIHRRPIQLQEALTSSL